MNISKDFCFVRLAGATPSWFGWALGIGVFRGWLACLMLSAQGTGRDFYVQILLSQFSTAQELQHICRCMFVYSFLKNWLLGAALHGSAVMRSLTGQLMTGI